MQGAPPPGSSLQAVKVVHSVVRSDPFLLEAIEWKRAGVYSRPGKPECLQEYELGRRQNMQIQDS